MQPSKEAFDLPSSAVASEHSTVLRLPFPAVAPVRGNQFHAMALVPLLIESIAVVGRIADHLFRLGADEPLRECGFDESGFMRRSAGDASGERKTMAVCDRHDFTAFSAPSRADSRAPFFALEKLASMKVSERSNLPLSRRSSANRCRRRVSVPSRCHC